MLTHQTNNTLKHLLFLLIILALLSCSGCTSTTQEYNNDPLKEDQNTNLPEDDTIEPTLKTPLQVAVIHFPPFEIVQDGQFTGPGIEVVREAFSRMGYDESEYQFVEYPWARILEMSKNGEVDVVIDISKSSERMEYLLYSEEPYAEYSKNFMVLKSAQIDYDGTIDSLGNKVIGVVRDYKISDSYQEARKSGQYQFEDADTLAENVNKLLNGRVPVILDSKYAVLEYLHNIGQVDDIQVLEPPFGLNTTYVAFTKKQHEQAIVDTYDSAIDSMIEDGTIEKIHSKYFK